MTALGRNFLLCHLYSCTRIIYGRIKKCNCDTFIWIIYFYAARVRTTLEFLCVCVFGNIYIGAARNSIWRVLHIVYTDARCTNKKNHTNKMELQIVWPHRSSANKKQNGKHESNECISIPCLTCIRGLPGMYSGYILFLDCL